MERGAPAPLSVRLIDTTCASAKVWYSPSAAQQPALTKPCSSMQNLLHPFRGAPVHFYSGVLRTPSVFPSMGATRQSSRCGPTIPGGHRPPLQHCRCSSPAHNKRLLDCGSKVSISERRHRFGINLGALLQPQKAPSSGLPRMFHNLAVLA